MIGSFPESTGRMRSNLTRSVFRQLLSNDGLLLKCPNRIVYSSRYRHGGCPVLDMPTRRTLFGFSRKPPRPVKETDLDPGLNKMLELFLMHNMKARAPPAADLIKAFNQFFAHKNRLGQPVNNYQARHALKTFQHLQDTNTDEEGFGFSLLDLRTARDALMKIPNDRVDTHNEFARALFEEISKRTKTGHEANTEGSSQASHQDLRKYAHVLSSTGNALEARSLAAEFWNATTERNVRRQRTGAAIWIAALKGFAREDNPDRLLETVELAREAGVPFDPAFHHVLTAYWAARDNVKATKIWYGKSIEGGNKPSAATLFEVYQFCVRTGELEWCTTVFRDLIESNPTKATWDVVFQWAAGALGKGVEDVERMMDVMIRRNPDDPSVCPDIATINGLVRMAIGREDAYLAERYIALGQKRGIRSNAKTFILIMDYRISAKDLSGAQAAYESLQAEEVTGGEDLPVINKYIRALCSADEPDFDRISSITTDLNERNAHLEADTVSALCMLNLKRNDLHEVVDLLQAHSFHHTLDERARTRDAFLAFCLDRRNSTQRAWDCYTIMRQVFEETDTDIRTRIMQEFFARKRSDMACHVFGHMRQHMQPSIRPTADAYIACFEGIAKSADIESLDLVHNMMKMDVSIEPSTRLYNALMIAYTAVEEPTRALQFWEDITNSREGPTYSSIQIVFRACERAHFGDRRAKVIWSKMRKMGIDVPVEVFAAYVGAIGGGNLVEEGKELVEGMEADLGFKPDAQTYVSKLAYNVRIYPSMMFCLHSIDWGSFTTP